MPNQYGTATRHSTIIGVFATPTKYNGPAVTSFSNPLRSSWKRSHLTVVRFTRCSSPSHRPEPAEQVHSGMQIAMRPGISSLFPLERSGKGRGPAACGSKNVLCPSRECGEDDPSSCTIQSAYSLTNTTCTFPVGFAGQSASVLSSAFMCNSRRGKNASYAALYDRRFALR